MRPTDPCATCPHTYADHTVYGDCAHRDERTCPDDGGRLMRLDAVGFTGIGRCAECGQSWQLAPVCPCEGFVDWLGLPECKRPDADADVWMRCSCDECAQARREEAAERRGENI